jgi:hypothetical protein
MKQTITAETRTKATYRNAKQEALYFALGTIQDKANELEAIVKSSPSKVIQEILSEKANALKDLKESILSAFEDGRM